MRIRPLSDGRRPRDRRGGRRGRRGGSPSAHLRERGRRKSARASAPDTARPAPTDAPDVRHGLLGGHAGGGQGTDIAPHAPGPPGDALPSAFPSGASGLCPPTSLPSTGSSPLPREPWPPTSSPAPRPSGPKPSASPGSSQTVRFGFLRRRLPGVDRISDPANLGLPKLKFRRA